MRNILLLCLALAWTTTSAQQMTRTIGKYGSEGNLMTYTSPEETKDVYLYLHGLGERGNTEAEMISRLERNEIPALFKQGVVKPGVWICPQLKADKTSWGRNQLTPLFNILDTYKARGYDLHVTGLSLGGIGTYAAIQYAYEYNGNKPGYFKTAASVCGKTATKDYYKFYKTYLKIWHGSNDRTVYPQPDRELFNALTPLKQDSVEYKEYEGWSHNVWELAYSVTPRKENSRTTINGIYMPTNEETYWSFLERVDPLPAQDSTETADQIYILNGRQGVIETKGGKYFFNVTK